MPRTRYTEGQIALVVRELENGAKVEEIGRKLGVSEQTICNWKWKFAGMTAAKLRKLKQLEEENAPLKRVVADLTLAKEIIEKFSVGVRQACMWSCNRICATSASVMSSRL